MITKFPINPLANFSFMGDGTRNGSFPPGGPPGIPPSPPGGGSRNSSSPLGELIESLSQAVPVIRVASFARALSGVVEGYKALNEGAPAAAADRAMEAMTSSLVLFVGRDMDQVSSTSWNLAASALYAAGAVILLRGEDSQSAPLSADLFQAMAAFERETHASPRNRRGVSAEDLFLNDRYLGNTILALKGWYRADDADCFTEANLGRVLVRLGLASGASHWPRLGVGLPNLSGAVSAFFDGGEVAMFEGVRLLSPLSYFQAAFGWRVGSLGYLEMAVASVLDGAPASKTQRIVREASQLFPNDRTVQRLTRKLNRLSSREEALENIFDELENWSDRTAAGIAETSLPLFLQLARAETH